MKYMVWFSLFISTALFAAEKDNLFVKYQTLAATMHKPRFKLILDDDRMYRDRLYLRRKAQHGTGFDAINAALKADLKTIPSAFLIIASLAWHFKSSAEKIDLATRHNQVFTPHLISILGNIIKQYPGLLFTSYPEKGNPLFSANEYVKITDNDIRTAVKTGLKMGVMQTFLDREFVPSRLAKEISHATIVNLLCNKTGSAIFDLNEKYEIVKPDTWAYLITSAAGNITLPLIATKLVGMAISRVPMIIDAGGEDAQGNNFNSKLEVR